MEFVSDVATRCREDTIRWSKRGVRYSKPPPLRRPKTGEFGKLRAVGRSPNSIITRVTKRSGDGAGNLRPKDLEDGALAAENYADLHGRRKALLIGLIVFEPALAACGVAATETL
jgi:hypothetical protein